jgi:hypothetical protein
MLAYVGLHYWLPTTVTATAATVYYDVRNGGSTMSTAIQNLTSELLPIASSLVPDVQRTGIAPYLGTSTVKLVYDTTNAPAAM